MLGARSDVPMNERISIRNLKETELDEADRIMRLAFGTFLGLPKPTTFMGDAAYVQPRWRTDPSAAFAAEVDGTRHAREPGANRIFQFQFERSNS